MQRLISAIQDWPVIVQGAVGSGLFWLILIIGQRITTFLSGHLATRSNEKKKTVLRNELLRFEALRSDPDQSGAFYPAVLWYRASRSVIKAIMWLALGLIFNAVSPILGIVGYVGCLYFLLIAWEVVRPLKYDGDIEQRIKDLKNELADFDKT